MLPEFKVHTYDFKRAKKDFVGEQKVMDELASIFDGSDDIKDLANAPVEFKEWFEINKDNYKYDKPKITKIHYDFSKSPQENSIEARNNLLIDMMWSILTNADTVSKILNPGGFDYQKKAARIVTILNSTYKSDLYRILGGGSIIDKLMSMSLDELDNLAKRTKKSYDPLSPVTQVQFHQQNMTGAKLIGIYANHNANHALMQHTELGLDDENGAFILNGKKLTSLHNIKNSNGEFISRNNAGFLAASVDNVKDPVLAGLNQNTLTADASMLLSRLGYNPIEIGLLMSQPIVMDITRTYFRDGRYGKSKDTIIKDIISEYRKKAAMMEDSSYDNYKKNDFSIEELANNIIISKEMIGITSSHQTDDYSKVEFYKKQVAIGYLFSRIMKTSDSLGQLVQATRADTQGGAAGPTIADTKIKIQKVQDFLEGASSANFPLVGAEVILDISLEGATKDELRKQLLSSPLPFLQAFYTLGLRKTEDMLGMYFPQYTTSFDTVVNTLRNMTKRGRLNVKTMNSIYNDLLAYIMSKTTFFGSEILNSGDSNIESITVSSSERRKEFINNFPTYFKDVVSRNADIADLEFIKRLKTIRANDTDPVETVIFKNVGQLSSTLKERYMRDWASLLYSSNPEAQSLALNLFRYSFYRNGFAFGPNTFIHLAPVAVRMAIPEYIDTLRSLATEEDDYSYFIDQYIYNHLDNRQLVPEIPDSSTTKFADSNKEILDTVTFVMGDNSNYDDDEKVVLEKERTPEGTSYTFFSYIARRQGGKYVYYTLIESTDTTATYKRIEPLGAKNSFIEYEYGKEASEMTSVIDRSKSNKHNISSVDLSLFNTYNTPQVQEDIDRVNTQESLQKKAMEDSLSANYGESWKSLSGKPDNDMLSISPDEGYVDATGLPSCASF